MEWRGLKSSIKTGGGRPSAPRCCGDETRLPGPKFFLLLLTAVVLGMMTTGSIANPVPSSPDQDQRQQLQFPCGLVQYESSEDTGCTESDDSCDKLGITVNITKISLKRLLNDNSGYFSDSYCSGNISLKDQHDYLKPLPSRTQYDCSNYTPLHEVIISHQVQLLNFQNHSLFKDVPNKTSFEQLYKNVTFLNCIFMCRCRGLNSSNINEFLFTIKDMFEDVKNTTDYKMKNCMITTAIKRQLDILSTYATDCNY